MKSMIPGHRLRVGWSWSLAAGMVSLAFAAPPSSPPAHDPARPPTQGDSVRPPAPGDPAASTKKSSSTDPSAEDQARLVEQVRKGVRQLAHPDYHVRQTGREAMEKLGFKAVEPLRRAYHATDDLAVRLEIEGIVMEAYLYEHLYSKYGFLGISMQPIPLPRFNHPDVSSEGVGIRIESVVSDSAADEAGLQAGDIIVLLDGQPIRDTNFLLDDPNTFSSLLSARGAGGKIKLAILRGDPYNPRRFRQDEELIEREVTLKARPARYFLPSSDREFLRNQPNHVEARRQTLLHFAQWWSDHFLIAPSP